jgi:hypothetical protein
MAPMLSTEVLSSCNPFLITRWLTARFGLAIIFSDSREEAEERMANPAAMHCSYYYAKQQGFGRCLTEQDL